MRGWSLLLLLGATAAAAQAQEHLPIGNKAFGNKSGCIGSDNDDAVLITKSRLTMHEASCRYARFMPYKTGKTIVHLKCEIEGTPIDLSAVVTMGKHSMHWRPLEENAPEGTFSQCAKNPKRARVLLKRLAGVPRKFWGTYCEDMSKCYEPHAFIIDNGLGFQDGYQHCNIHRIEKLASNSFRVRAGCVVTGPPEEIWTDDLTFGEDGSLRFANSGRRYRRGAHNPALPIGGRVFGNELGCRVAGGEDIRSDSHVLVNRRGIERHENSCKFTQLRSIGRLHWKAKLQCSGEGERYTYETSLRLWDRAMTLQGKHGFERLDECSSKPKIVNRPRLVQRQPRQIESSEEPTAGVTEIQALLYRNNFDVTVDGKFGPQTAKAIRQFERLNKMPLTGSITHDLARRLRASTPPRPWGAIAFTANGAHSAGWNFATRAQAEDRTRKRVRRRNRGRITVVRGWGNACISLASYRTRRFYGHTALTGQTIDGVESALLAACQQKFGVKCLIVNTICADGRHDPKSKPRVVRKRTGTNDAKRLDGEIGALERQIKVLQRKMGE